MGWEGDFHVDGINNSTKQDIASGTWTVPCVQILEREELLALFGVLTVEGPGHLVQRVEECVTNMEMLVLWPLRQYQEIVHKHIHIRQ